MAFRKLEPIGPLSIQLTDKHVELEKRTYIPARLTSTCPGCKTEVYHDLSGQYYMSYPYTNRPNTYHFSHECLDGTEYIETEWSYELIVRITIEQAP